MLSFGTGYTNSNLVYNSLIINLTIFYKVV